MSILTSAASEPGSHPVVAAPSTLASVLVIDDDEMVGKTLSALLRAEGLNAVVAPSGEEGVKLLRGRQFEVAIADLVMPGMNGIQTLVALKEADPDIEVILLTGYATVESTIAALREGACDFLLKPLGAAELRAAVQRALDKRRPKAALPVYEASRPLLATLDGEQLVPAALKLAQRTLRATAAALALVPAAGPGLRVHLSEDSATFTASVATKIAEIAMRAGEPLRNLRFDHAPYPGDEVGMTAGSVLAYPLAGRESPIGALVLWRAPDLAPFSVFDWQQGKLLADEIVIAIDNARLYRGLQESEAKLQAIFDGVKIGILVIDPETRQIVDANPLALELIGANRGSVVGSVCHKFVCPAATGRCPVADLRQVVDDSERILLTATGQTLNIIKTVRPVVIGGRKLLLESFVDITSRKQAEQALAEAEEHFRSLFASIPLPTFVFDAETLQYLDVNDAALSGTGYSREELLKLRVVDLAPPEAASHILATMQALPQKSLEPYEGRYQLKDGRIIDVESALRVLDFHGRKAVLSVSQDVSARKRAAADMAEQHRLAALVADVGEVLTRADSLRQGLQQCAEILVRNIDAAFARVWTLQEAEGVLELQASAGIYTHINGGHARVPVGKFKIGRIAENGEPHLSNSVQQDPWVGDPEWARREGMVAFAGYPLKVEGRVLGVVAAFARQPLSETTIQAFSAVVDNIAQFIKRKRAEEALRESEGRYRDLVESSAVLIGTHDPQGRILSANTAACRFLEVTNAEEVAGRSLTSYVPPELRPQFEEYLATILRDGHAEGLMVLNTPSGKRKIVEYRNTLRRRDSEAPIIRWTGQDVTERIQAEEALRDSENRYRLLFEGNLAGVLRTTPEGQILECNESMARMLGYDSPRELLNAHVGQIWEDPLDRERMIAKLAEQGSLSNYDIRLRRKDGKPVWALLNVHRIAQDTGEAASVVGTVVDITQRKQAEESLLLTQFSVEHASDAVTWLDSQGRIIYVNEETCRSLGRSREDLLACRISEIDPDFPPGAWAKEWERIKAAGTATFEARHITKLGQIFPVEVNATFQAFGGKEYLFTFARDIRQRKETDRQMHLQVTALKAASSSIVITDQEGRIQWVNPAFTRLTGYQAAEVIGRNPRLLKSGMQDLLFYQNLWRTVQSGEVWRGELVNRRKDGATYAEEMTITPVRDERGIVTHFVAIQQDISQRKQAERALEERTVYLNALFEISPVGIAVLDMKGCIQMANSTFEKLFLYPREEILGANLDELIVPPEFVAEARTLTALCQEGGGVETPGRRRRKDGTLVDAEIYGVPLVIDGELRGYLGLYQDITRRKQAEADLIKYAEDLEASHVAQEQHAQELARLVEELAQERDLLSAVMNNLPDFIFYKDRQSRFLRTNPAHAKLLGLSDPRQAVGKTDFDFFPEEDARAYFGDEQQVIETGQPLVGRIEKARQPDGQHRWYSTNKVAIRDMQGRVTGLVGISRDITPSKLAEETLRASEERYRELFENASDIVYTTGLDTRLTSLNRVGQQILGYSVEEAIQLDLHQIVPPKHWELIKRSRERLAAGESDITFEVEAVSKDGRPMMLEVKPRLIYRGGKPVGVQGIARDITGRDEAEVQLRHAQKLESVGRLAAGIAHEINTPIQFVGDNTRFLQDSFGGLQTLLSKYQELRDAVASGANGPDLLEQVHRAEEESDCVYLMEEIPKALAQTLDGVSRVATIVRAMKEFAHPEGKEMAAADLNHALSSTLTVARNELKYVADVETEFGDLPLVVCNIGDLNQVFLNLLVNAAHAIGESVKGTGNKGKIRVRTLAEGRTVLVTIADTGCGIPEANRARVFDPFFTTKEVGRGTGQGLAIARSVVVDRHKGTLTFESEVGKGTTFFIRLPVDPGECCKEARVP